MKTLFILLVAVTLCLVPVMTKAGNINPVLYLEIYEYDTDPDDPDAGCMLTNACPEICYHATRPLGEALHCYNLKHAYFIGVVPLHVAKLATPPLAAGWPLPCGPGGGYVTVSYGLQRTGAALTFLGMGICPNFLQGPGTPPGAILVTATTACHDWIDHPCYGKYLCTASAGVASYFTVIGNIEDANVIDLINCQVGTEASKITVGGQAQWGGSKTLTCAMDPTAVTSTTWGAIKGLYR